MPHKRKQKTRRELKRDHATVVYENGDVYYLETGAYAHTLTNEGRVFKCERCNGKHILPFACYEDIARFILQEGNLGVPYDLLCVDGEVIAVPHGVKVERERYVVLLQTLTLAPPPSAGISGAVQPILNR